MRESVASPGRALERALRREVILYAGELLPEFRSHIERCPACGGFHEWLLWRHRTGLKWAAACPRTNRPIMVKLS
jgi:hypothetical protein